MNRSKRHPLLLVISLVSLTALALLVNLFPPNWSLVVGHWSLATLSLFFPLFFLFIFSSIAYLFKSKVHGNLIASFTIIYLIFRLNNLTHPFFLVLLLLLLVTLELLVSYKSKSSQQQP